MLTVIASLSGETFAGGTSKFLVHRTYAGPLAAECSRAVHLQTRLASSGKRHIGVIESSPIEKVSFDPYHILERFDQHPYHNVRL